MQFWHQCYLPPNSMIQISDIIHIFQTLSRLSIVQSDFSQKNGFCNCHWSHITCQPEYELDVIKLRLTKRCACCLTKHIIIIIQPFFLSTGEYRPLQDTSNLLYLILFVSHLIVIQASLWLVVSHLILEQCHLQI